MPLPEPAHPTPPCPCRLIKLIKPWTEESSDEEGSEGEAEEGGDGAAGGPPVGQQVGSDVCRALVLSDLAYSGMIWSGKPVGQQWYWKCARLLLTACNPFNLHPACVPLCSWRS